MLTREACPEHYDQHRLFMCRFFMQGEKEHVYYKYIL